MLVEEMSDSEIRTMLSKYGYPVGPVTQTTRGTLVKKLKSLIEARGGPGGRHSLAARWASFLFLKESTILNKRYITRSLAFLRDERNGYVGRRKERENERLQSWMLLNLDLDITSVRSWCLLFIYEILTFCNYMHIYNNCFSFCPYRELNSILFSICIFRDI